MRFAAARRHHIFGPNTTGPKLPCNSEVHGSKAGLSQKRDRRGRRAEAWLLVAHQRFSLAKTWTQVAAVGDGRCSGSRHHSVTRSSFQGASLGRRGLAEPKASVRTPSWLSRCCRRGDRGEHATKGSGDVAMGTASWCSRGGDRGVVVGARSGSRPHGEAPGRGRGAGGSGARAGGSSCCWFGSASRTTVRFMRFVVDGARRRFGVEGFGGVAELQGAGVVDEVSSKIDVAAPASPWRGRG